MGKSDSAQRLQEFWTTGEIDSLELVIRDAHYPERSLDVNAE